MKFQLLQKSGSDTRFAYRNSEFCLLVCFKIFFERPASYIGLKNRGESVIHFMLIRQEEMIKSFFFGGGGLRLFF